MGVVGISDAGTSSPDPVITPGRLDGVRSFEATLAQYEASLARLESWGIAAPPSSRLQSYVVRLREAIDQDSLPLQRLEQLSFVLADVSELIEIADSFSVPTDRALGRLRELAGGELHPDHEDRSPSRDAQAELWLRTFFSARGIPCEMTDPDLAITWGGATIRVEVKRPKSAGALDTRFRKALKQLTPYSEGGIAALSLDGILRPRHHVLFAESREDASWKMDYLFREQLKELVDQQSPLSRRGPGRNAVGILVTAKLPIFLELTNQFGIEFRSELLWMKEDLRREALNGLRDRVSSYARND